MALVNCNCFSQALELEVDFNVILPESWHDRRGEGKIEPIPEEGYRTLYLLHGLSDNHMAWEKRTSIERYAEPYNLAVVMPAVGRSFYTDMKRGLDYWTFVSEELPLICRSLFPLSSRRRDNFVAGLSMGGYGAFKLALRKPEDFAAAASLSGAVDMVGIAEEEGGEKDEDLAEELTNIFGPFSQLKGSPNDLSWVAKELARTDKPKPRLFQCCGTEDDLYRSNLRFKQLLEELDFPLTYEESPAEHEWSYWDRKIQRVLEWLPL